MCGLVAYFNYHQSAPPIDCSVLVRVRDSMIRRGPDGSGLWITEDQRVGLAHRRLAIVDLTEAGSQPMASEDNTLHIVFNGEIYNYRQLRHLLQSDGCCFRSTSDTEVLLHLYQKYGQDLVKHIRGMYAFAIWDSTKRGIFIARDPFGIKPLYYADDGNTIRVASQVKALLLDDRVDKSPDPAGHVGFYLWGHVPDPYTLFKGIRAHPAGTSLWLDSTGKRESRQFFDLAQEMSAISSIPSAVDKSENQERLRSALLDSISSHLIGDVPVGVFLSAGIDSNVILALSSQAANSKLSLQSVTLGFKEYVGTLDDETPVASASSKYYGVPHQICWKTREDFDEEYRNILDCMDQPTTDGVNGYFVSKAAREVGLKVALSGVGGDELFGGYPSFQQIPRLVRSLSPFRRIPNLGSAFRIVSAAIIKHYTSPKYASLLEYGGSFGGAYLLRRGMFMPWELPGLLDGDLVRAGWAELKTLLSLDQTSQGVDSDRLKIMLLETSWYMRNQLLRDTDWASMAHSVEVRTPLVDIELYRALSPMIRSNTPPTKDLLALSVQPPLPHAVMQREKSGFAIPISEWSKPRSNSHSAERGLRGWAKQVYASVGCLA